MVSASAQDVIQLLGLTPHPEGGHYRETFRDASEAAARSVSTAIYYLLAAGEVSRWHRVDATEVWHWYAGCPLLLSINEDEQGRATFRRDHTLGNDLASGAQPQIAVPARQWQQARCLGRWTLAGCTVAPGFTFAGFEIAPHNLFDAD